jgi:hypothetical protein
VSESAELLPEPFTLLAGPAAPYVRLGASAHESDEVGPPEIRPDVELGAKPDTRPHIQPPAHPRVATPAEPVAAAAPPESDVAAPAEPGVVAPAEPAVAAPAEPASATATASPSSATRPRPTTRVVSGRGVTGRGIVVLILIVTGLVGVLEVAIAGHRGHAFGIAFVVSSAIGALIVRRRDLPTALIAPPLLYCVLIVAMSVIDHHDVAGGRLTREGVYLGNAFVTGAPALWTGTAAAALVVWYRWRAARRNTSAS